MKNPFLKIKEFTQEIGQELKKASWPSMKELRNSTVMVIIAIFLLSFYVSIVDFSLFQIVQLFSSWFRPV